MPVMDFLLEVLCAKKNSADQILFFVQRKQWEGNGNLCLERKNKWYGERRNFFPGRT